MVAVTENTIVSDNSGAAQVEEYIPAPIVQTKTTFSDVSSTEIFDGAPVITVREFENPEISAKDEIGELQASTPSEKISETNNIEFESVFLNSVGNAAFEYAINNSANNKLPMLDLRLMKWQYFISPYVSYNNYQRNFGSLSSNLIKKDEQELASFGYGVDVIVKKKNFSVSTGIGILNLRENTNYKQDKFEYQYDSSLVVMSRDFTTDPRGNPVALITYDIDTTATLVGQEVVCADCIASFSYISVPLNLGYEVNKGRMAYFGEAGVTASVLRSVHGLYSESQGVDNNGEQVFSVTELVSNNDVSSMLFQANAAIGARYNLNSKIGFWASAGYGYSLSSMFNSYSHLPKLQTLKLGVQYKLR